MSRCATGMNTVVMSTLAPSKTLEMLPRQPRNK